MSDLAASLRLDGADGITLAAERLDGTRGVTVVLLHGGGQTRGAWGATARRLNDDGWTTLAVDLRGHGDSDWAPDGDYRLERYAADIAAVVAALGEPAVLVGASLGGLSAMTVLREHPELPVAGLVLVDVAHRIEPVGASRVLDFMRSRPDGFADLAEAQAAVAAYLPHRPPPRDAEGLRRNLRERDGRLRWHWDPAILRQSRDAMPVEEGNLREQRLRAVVRDATIPIRLVRGAESDVVSDAVVAEFRALNADADVVEVPGARHMVAGDRNDAFTAAIVDFLERHAVDG